MTYTDIFKEIYINNKKFIYVFLTFTIVFSFFSFYSYKGTYATIEMNELNETDSLELIGGDAGKVLAALLSSQCIGIDLPGGMFFLSGVSFIIKSIPEDVISKFSEDNNIKGLNGVRNFSFGLFDNNFVRFFSLMWFIVARFLKGNKLTNSTAVILEKVNVKIGKYVSIMISLINLLSIMGSNNTVHAAGFRNIESLASNNIINVFLSMFIIICGLIVFLLIRYFLYFLDIIAVPASAFIPFFAFFKELLMTIFIIVMFSSLLFFPELFIVFSLLIIFLSIILFKKIYITVRYFENIYVKPFFKKLFGYNSEISLISNKAPRKVKKFTSDQNIDILIPIYIIRKFDGNKYTRKHDRWWIVVSNKTSYICKPNLFKEGCVKIELNSTVDKKIFIKKSLRFFEIFNLKGGEENLCKLFRKVNKNIHFVFSKEYFYKYDMICNITGFTDYNNYTKMLKDNIKLSRKEAREQKRIEKLERREEQRLLRKQKNYKKLV